MQLIQIGQKAAEVPTVTIREMFEQLARREQDMIRNARLQASSKAERI